MGSNSKYILLIMLAMSLEMVKANDTDSKDLFTLLEETCPYWQVISSVFFLIKHSFNQKMSLLRPFRDGSYNSQLHEDIVADKYKQGEPPKTNLSYNPPIGIVGLTINVQDNYKLEDDSQTLTLSGNYVMQWGDDRS